MKGTSRCVDAGSQSLPSKLYNAAEVLGTVTAPQDVDPSCYSRTTHFVSSLVVVVKDAVDPWSPLDVGQVHGEDGSRGPHVSVDIRASCIRHGSACKNRKGCGEAEVDGSRWSLALTSRPWSDPSGAQSDRGTHRKSSAHA